MSREIEIKKNFKINVIQSLDSSFQFRKLNIKYYRDGNESLNSFLQKRYFNLGDIPWISEVVGSFQVTHFRSNFKSCVHNFLLGVASIFVACVTRTKKPLQSDSQDSKYILSIFSMV